MKLIIKLCKLISRANKVTASITCWISLPLIFVLIYEIISRYFFNKPTSWAYDMTWMLFGSLGYLGAGYTHLIGGHVRVDVIYKMFPLRIQALIEVICYCIFFFPIMYMLVVYTYDLAHSAWLLGVKSPFTMWKPVTWPVKTALFFGLSLLLLQGIVGFVEHLHILIKGSRMDDISS